MGLLTSSASSARTFVIRSFLLYTDRSWGSYTLSKGQHFAALTEHSIGWTLQTSEWYVMASPNSFHTWAFAQAPAKAEALLTFQQRCVASADLRAKGDGKTSFFRQCPYSGSLLHKNFGHGPLDCFPHLGLSGRCSDLSCEFTSWWRMKISARAFYRERMPR